MNNYDVPPPWLPDDSQDTSPYVQQLASLLRTLQEAVDTARPQLPLPRDVHKFLDELRPAMAAVGRLPLPPPELMRVMNAGLREMLSPARQQRDVVVHGAVATASVTAPAGSVLVTDGGTAKDTLTAQKASPSEVGMPLDAKTVFLGVMWIFAILLPLKIGLLSPDVQTIISGYLVTIGTALIIHWRVTDSRKPR